MNGARRAAGDPAHEATGRPCMLLAALGCLATFGCQPSASAPAAQQVQDGNASVGRAIVASGAHGCTGCHAIPGIRFPRGLVGPPLAGVARRAFIAGQLPNQPSTLIAFLQDPPALVPGTGMPDVRVSLEEARHIAAFLYTLESADER